MANKIKIDNALLKRQKLKEANKHPKKKIPCRILIVCEGSKTEPNYFDHFRTEENKHFIYDIECEGNGFNTIDVVDTAIARKEAAEKSPIPYDSVWAVFDRDDFSKARFNAAIAKAEAHGIKVAWSNEAFELWYLYHFHNRITAMTRDEYAKAISEAVNKSEKWKRRKPYKYAKNDPQNYDIMTRYGDMEQAIKWAEQQHKSFDDGQQHADYNPCTLVYKLVRQLLNRDLELIEQVMSKINGDATGCKKECQDES